jgi:hypothetical protein
MRAACKGGTKARVSPLESLLLARQLPRGLHARGVRALRLLSPRPMGTAYTGEGTFLGAHSGWPALAAMSAARVSSSGVNPVGVTDPARV